jgi:hypothetical protein
LITDLLQLESPNLDSSNVIAEPFGDADIRLGRIFV